MINTLVLVGIRFSGKHTAMRYLEELGYTTIEHVSLRMLPLAYQSNDRLMLLIEPNAQEPMGTTAELLRRLREETASIEILFFDVDDSTFFRRMAERGESGRQSEHARYAQTLVAQRRASLPYRAAADLVINTSSMDVSQLRQLLRKRYLGDSANSNAVLMEIVTFSYLCGPVRDAHFTLDLRILETMAFAQQKTHMEELLVDIEPFLTKMVCIFEAQEHTRFCVALGCSDGATIASEFAERLKRLMTKTQFTVTIFNRDLE